MEGSGEEVNSRTACHRILFVGAGAACCEMPCLSAPVTPRLLWLSIRESRAGRAAQRLAGPPPLSSLSFCCRRFSSITRPGAVAAPGKGKQSVAFKVQKAHRAARLAAKAISDRLTEAAAAAKRVRAQCNWLCCRCAVDCAVLCWLAACFASLRSRTAPALPPCATRCGTFIEASAHLGVEIT